MAGNSPSIGCSDRIVISGKNCCGDYEVVRTICPVVHCPGIDNFLISSLHKNAFIALKIEEEDGIRNSGLGITNYKLVLALTLPLPFPKTLLQVMRKNKHKQSS